MRKLNRLKSRHVVLDGQAFFAKCLVDDHGENALQRTMVGSRMEAAVKVEMEKRGLPIPSDTKQSQLPA